MSLKFKCPKCKREDLEIIETDVIMTSLIVDIDEENCFMYDLIDSGGGQVDRFQCSECGYVLKDDAEQVITTEEEVVEWVRKNCCQEEKS